MYPEMDRLALEVGRQATNWRNLLMIRQVMHGKMMSLSEWSTNIFTCRPGYEQKNILYVSVTATLLLRSTWRFGRELKKLKKIHIPCRNFVL